MKATVHNKKDLLDYIKNKTEEVLLYLDTKLATEIQEELESILEKQQNILLWDADEKAFFVSSLIKVKFIRLTSLGDSEVCELISTNMIDGLKIENYNLLETIGKKIKYLGVIDDQIVFMENLKKAIESCVQELGKGLIKSDNKLLNPSIKNWIIYYFSFPYKTALRTNLDEWNFVNQSEARKILDNDERKILLEALKIYDSLRNYINEYKSLPETDKEEEIYSNLDLYKMPGFLLIYKSDDIIDNAIWEDDSGVNSINQDSGSKIGANILSVPAPRNQPSIAPNFDISPLNKAPRSIETAQYSQKVQEGKPIQKPMGEVVDSRITRPQSSSTPALGGQGESENRKPNVLAQAGAKDRKMDLEDTEVRPGLKMWNSAPPQMGERIKNQELRIKEDTNNKVVEISSAEVVIENKTEDTSAQIDKKLEELEKRVIK